MLEAVLTVVVGTMAAVFAAAFFSQQISLYGRHGKMRGARFQAERVCTLIDETLSLGFRFSVDPARPERLRFWTMEEEGRREYTLTKEMFWDEASWEIQLEFFEPEYGRVKARVMVLEDEELLWREERTFISLYEEGRDNGR